jgi:general secretion pathway protein K
MTGRRGIALLIVVALLGALAMTAGMAALSARLSTSHAFADLEQLELSAAIDSAAARTAFHLSQADAEWIADGRLYEWQVDGLTVRVRPLAEAGRFDLNRGDVSVLAALMEDQNVPPLTAGRIAGAVADWRDADSDVGDNGAEAAAYRAEGRPPPPNRPFLAVAEFRSVLGVDEAIFETLAPYLTVNGGDTVAARLAPPELIEAAGLSAGQARRILAARRANRPLPVLDDAAPADPAQSGVFALFIEVDAPNHAMRAREIIISLPGEEGLYDTLSRHSHVMGYADFLDPERGN